MDKREELLQKPLSKLMLELTVPAIIGMVVIGLYSFMDGVFVGQLVGSNAMAAVSVAYPITFLNSGISTLIGIGSASVLSRAIGKDDKSTVDKIMGNLIGLVLIFSIIITIIGTIFTRGLLSASGASGEILDLAEHYLRIVFIGSVFVNFAQSSNMVMRGEGLMKTAMMIMGLGALLNIILDPIFITIFKDNGVQGAAYATLTSQIVQAIVSLVYFIRKSKKVRIHKIKIDSSIAREVFQVGVSAMMMQVLAMVQQTILFRMAFKYGGDLSGIVMSASLRLQAFSFIPMWGMAQGLQPIVGTNFGAKKFDRVKKATYKFILWATIFAGIFWLFLESFTPTVLHWFITDQSIVTAGVPKFRVFYSIFFLYGAMIMILTFFQSVGNGKVAGNLVFIRQLIVFVPAMILFPMFLGESAVWFTMPAIDLLVIVFSFIFLKKELNKMIGKNASMA